MIQYVAGTDEIEITVLSEVHQSWAIGFGLVFGQQFVVIRQRIRDFYLQATWVTLITIGAHQGQLHPGTARIIEWGCVPQSFIKPCRATVQIVRTVVAFQAERFTIERKTAVGDAGAHPTNPRPQTRRGAKGT